MGLSNAERQERWRKRRQRHVAEIEKERDHYRRMAEGKAAKPLRNEGQEITRLQARIAELEAARPAVTRPGPDRRDETARIRALERKLAAAGALSAETDRELARLRRENADLKARIVPTTKPATAAPERVKLSMGDYKKLVRNLHPDRWDYLKDAELTEALNQAFQIQQQLFEPVKKAAEQARERPIDWPEVESAVKAYTEGKIRVTINAVLKAVYARVPALDTRDRHEKLGMHVWRYVIGCLQRLGFRQRGEMTFERAGSAPTAAAKAAE
jgi:hypothetical protein